MSQRIQKNSKRGFGLPIAIIVSCFIVIIATTLLSIAVISTQRTSANTDSRQAYINAKAALDYAARYYESSDKLPEGSIGDNKYAEYMVMKDTGGTTSEGAAVVSIEKKDEEKVEEYKTYVYSKYDAAKSKITMTAYAKSSDSFGGHNETTTLSVTYEIGADGNGHGCRLSTAIEVATPSKSSDEVTIHVKKQDGNDFTPTIYAWSYYKKTNLGINWSKVSSVLDLTTDQANQIEKQGDYYKNQSNSNMVETDTGALLGYWSENKNGEGYTGPVAKMTEEGNNWYSTSFSPKNVGGNSGMVPWINLIVSRTEENSDAIGKKEDGTQSSEMFGVWYLDENDRNIYIELLDNSAKANLKYEKYDYWNGTGTLTDRMVVYANSKQTVYYVKMKGVTDESLNPTVTIKGGNYTANYSGYGWWSVRYEGIGYTDSVSMEISSAKMNNTVSVSSISSGSSNSLEGYSAYVVLEPSSDSKGNLVKNADGSYCYTASTYITEEAASVHMNDEDYVTVYAKVYDRTQSGSPTISYKVDKKGLSASKLALREAITDADALYESDYTKDSWEALVDVLNEAKELYNTEVEDESTLDYDSKTKLINEKVDALVFKGPDTDSLNSTAKSQYKAIGELKNTYINEIYAKWKSCYENAVEIVKRVKQGAHISQAQVDQTENELKAAYKELTQTVFEGTTDKKWVASNYKSKMLSESFLANAKNVWESNKNSEDENKKREAATLKSNIDKAETIRGSTATECNSYIYIDSVSAAIQESVERLTNAGDTTPLKDAIESANALIEENKDALSSGSVTNLESVISKVEDSISGKILSTSEVNKLKASLDEAIAALIYLPQDSDNLEIEEGKKRVWFDIDNSFGTDFYIYAWGDSGPNTEFDVLTSEDTTKKSEFKLQKDNATKYYYYDLDEKYKNIIIVTGTGNSKKQTVDVSIGEKLTKNLFIIGTEQENNKYKVTSAYITTVYVESDVPAGWDGNEVHAYVTNSESGKYDLKNTADNNALTVLDSSKRYYVTRIAYDSTSKFQLWDGKDLLTNDVELGIDPVVVRFKNGSEASGTDAYVIESNSYSELDKLKVSTEVATVSTSGTDAVVKNLDTDDGDDVSDETSAYVDTHVPDNSKITVYLTKPESWTGSYMTATLYSYDDSDNQLSAQTTTRMLITDDRKEYFLVLDTEFANRIEIKDENGATTDIIKFAVDKSTGKYYTTQQISQSSDDSAWTASAYTTSLVTIDTTNVTFDTNCSNKKMAYVGGRKKYFENYADLRSGRKDAYGSEVNNSRKFGGNWNGTDSGDGRVGTSSIFAGEDCEYYDWYEYKIPAGESDLYTFEIKGLDNKENSSSTTGQIHQVFGDVWVTLDSSKQACIYTVNPDDNVTSETTRVFIDINSTWYSENEGMSVTMWGTSMKTVKLSEKYDGMYYVDVPNNMPFLQITSADNNKAYAVTRLQGGDSVRYSYNGGKNGTPAWLTYVPAYEALERAVSSAKTVAKGWYIYDYDVSTQKVTTTYVPKALYTAATKYKIDSISKSDSDRTWENAAAANLVKMTEAYEDLYDAVSKARTYITVKDEAGTPVYYPEQDNNTTGAVYSNQQIANLYAITQEAINEYSKESVNVSDLIDYTGTIEDAISALSPTMTDTAIVMLDDTAGWNNNIWLKYEDSTGMAHDISVTSKNINGYPMAYISVPSGSAITNVRFYNALTNAETTKKGTINSGETWVCDNAADEWNENTIDNYYFFSLKSYNQYADEEMIAGDENNTFFNSSGNLNTGSFQPFTLYFTYETTVTYKNNKDETQSYTILPGAYYIDISNSYSNRYLDYYEGDLNNITKRPSYVNLYSDTAKNFFTSKRSQGFYSSGKDSNDNSIGWTESGKIVSTTARWSAGKVRVNFKAESGTLGGKYEANAISFRWYDTGNSLKVTSGASLIADEIKIASASSISGGKTITPTFTLKTNSKDSGLKVEFLTDTTIVYYDSSGKQVSYVILAGSYEAKKDEYKEVNIFSKSDWTSKMQASSSDDGTKNGGQTLTKPVYSLNDGD